MHGCVTITGCWRSFVTVLCFFWKEKNGWDSLPGIGYAKSCCLVQKDDREREAQGDSEKVTEDIRMRRHFKWLQHKGGAAVNVKWGNCGKFKQLWETCHQSWSTFLFVWKTFRIVKIKKTVWRGLFITLCVFILVGESGRNAFMLFQDC